MMAIGAIPETGVVTNGRISQHGGMALDAERERNPWTRTMLKVDISTGRVQRGPQDQEPQMVRTGRPRVNPAQYEILRLIIDEGLTDSEVCERLGIAPTLIGNSIDEARRRRVIQRTEDGGHEWVMPVPATEVKTYKIEEGDEVNSDVNPGRKKLFSLIIDEGTPIADAAAKAGYAEASARSILSEAVKEGLIVRVGRGVYVWPKDTPPEALRKQAPATAGLTAEQVQEMVQQAVAEAVGPLVERIAKLEETPPMLEQPGVLDVRLQHVEGWIKAESEWGERINDKVDSLRRDLDALAKKLEALNRSTAEWSDGIQGTVQGLRRDVDALEADVEELQQGKGATAPQGDVVALALRLLAAERGITA